jgi:hypothetical protein
MRPLWGLSFVPPALEGRGLVRGPVGALLDVQLVDQAQAGEREQVVDLGDLLGEWDDQAGEATGGDH